jgi:formamidase
LDNKLPSGNLFAQVYQMSRTHLAVDRHTPLSRAPHEGHNRWHPAIPPMCRICSGDTVEIETRDSFDCQICASMTSVDLKGTSLERAHPLTGPVYVEDAEPGDLLAVHIEEVIPASEGFTAIMPGFGFLRDIFTEPHLIHWQLKDGYATTPSLPGIRIPAAPFMGVMGLAPSEALLERIIAREELLRQRGGMVLPPNAAMAVPASEPVASRGIRTIAPHETGGNLDVKQTVAGTTLYLPVYEKGALFSVGDAHFAQGDGESCGTAIETSAVFVARFEVLKGEAERRRQVDASFASERPLAAADRPAPFYATTGTCITKDGDNRSEDITLAARNALLNMIDHIVDTYGYSAENAYALASVAVNLRISQVVDVPNVTVSAFLPTDIFE